MIVVVDTASVRLIEADSFTSLSVRTVLSSAASADALQFDALGSLDPGGAHVWIELSTLLELGRAHGADRAWEQNVEGMFGYAKSKGWTDESGRVRAHVE